MSIRTLPKRSEIPIEHTWNAESVFASAAEWEAQFAGVLEQIRGLSPFHGHMGDSAASLADWLAAVDRLNADIDKLRVYASMSRAVDTTNQQAAERFDRSRGLNAQALAATAFAEPELLAIGFDTLRRTSRSGLVSSALILPCAKSIGSPAAVCAGANCRSASVRMP